MTIYADEISRGGVITYPFSDCRKDSFFSPSSRTCIHLSSRAFFSLSGFSFLSLRDCPLISSHSPYGSDPRPFVARHSLLVAVNPSLEIRTIVLQSCRASPASVSFSNFPFSEFKQRDHVPAMRKPAFFHSQFLTRQMALSFTPDKS